MLGKICYAERSSIHKITSLPCHKLHSFSALINATYYQLSLPTWCHNGHIALQNSELVATLMFKCLNSSLVSTVSFAPINLYTCSTLEWKLLIGQWSYPILKCGNKISLIIQLVEHPPSHTQWKLLFQTRCCPPLARNEKYPCFSTV